MNQGLPKPPFGSTNPLATARTFFTGEAARRRPSIVDRFELCLSSVSRIRGHQPNTWCYVSWRHSAPSDVEQNAIFPKFRMARHVVRKHCRVGGGEDAKASWHPHEKDLPQGLMGVRMSTEQRTAEGLCEGARGAGRITLDFFVGVVPVALRCRH